MAAAAAAAFNHIIFILVDILFLETIRKTKRLKYFTVLKM
jgi:hypothetical protein